MTKKRQNRLLASLNYMCTYEKEIKLQNKSINIVDVIEEFDIQNCKLTLYGHKDKYVIDYHDIEYNIDETRVEITFIGTDEYKLMI